VIIGGISIDNCTLHTSLDLIRNGYNVYVVVDASSTNSKLAEEHRNRSCPCTAGQGSF
jgi:nicotinamidase-related amidase